MKLLLFLLLVATACAAQSLRVKAMSYRVVQEDALGPDKTSCILRGNNLRCTTKSPHPLNQTSRAYNLVETDTMRYVIACGLSSTKCVTLTPNSAPYKAELKGREMVVYSHDEKAAVKFHIVQAKSK